jgi:hypothetical protein
MRSRCCPCVSVFVCVSVYPLSLLGNCYVFYAVRVLLVPDILSVANRQML